MVDLVSHLQQIWGYQSFRYPQSEIVDCLLARQDALIVMPTGGGKSLCFQLPGLLQPGLTIVVSPLVALMENQVNQLKQKQLNQKPIAVGLLHSQQAKSTRALVLSKLTTLKLLYVAPETLFSPAVWQKLLQPEITIDSLVIDEAHCIWQWGTTFRPSYTRLGSVRKTLQKFQTSPITVAAFTATADAVIQKTISRSLALKNPQKFLLSPYRANHQLQIKTVYTPQGRKQQALKFIQQQKQTSGLVYVRSRKTSQDLAQWLQSKKINAIAYHAGVPTSQRRQIEQQWLTGKLPVVVCTSAFGLGVDKPDCRWVLHYQLPELLAEYLQEIGRAGRDGKEAIALGLRSEPTGWLDNSDRQRNQFFSGQIQQKFHQAQKLLTQLPERGDLSLLNKEIPNSELALAILHNSGLIEWRDPFHYRKVSQSQTKNLKRSHISDAQLIGGFLATKQCRWAYILAAYNCALPKPHFRCGKCDRCQE